jgi:23S rRNA pseudouridine1911/1915/1917 synthase
VAEQVLHFQHAKPDEARLDHFLVDSMPGYSRARLQTLIRGGFVSVNDSTVTKSGLLLAPDAAVEVRVPPARPSSLTPEHVELAIVFENSDLIVVDKPAGMVVHPAAGHAAGTLVHAILGYDPHMQGIGGEERPGVVHRLDKDTSGLIVLARNDRAHHWLQDQFKERRVEKTYLALVDGKPPTASGRIEAAIGRDGAHRKKMSIVPAGRGREAATEYRTLESFAAHTLLEMHPLTGRTHQIRLHCALLGCPIVGDQIYGRKKPSLPLGRHFLHAARLTLALPGESERRTFEAALPAELSAALDTLRKES